MHRFVLFTIIAALSLPATGFASSLTGKWRLASLEGVPSFDGSKTEMAFQADGRVAMTVGCNRMNATASIGDTALKFGPIMATKMMCPPRLMTLEISFQNAIGRTVSFKLEGDTLTLVDGSNTAMATFARQK